MKKLSDVEIDKEVKIVKLECEGNIRRRLLDLGLIQGCNIIPVLKAPFGDPIAYEIRGSTLALRKEETDLIKVEEP